MYRGLAHKFSEYGFLKDIIGVGKKIPKNVWDEVVREVDANGDGEVSFDEFKTMMRKLLQ